MAIPDEYCQTGTAKEAKEEYQGQLDEMVERVKELERERDELGKRLEVALSAIDVAHSNALDKPMTEKSPIRR